MATKKKTALSQAKMTGKTQSVEIEDVITLFAEVMMLLGAKRTEILNVVEKTKQVRLPKSVKLVKYSLSYFASILTRWADDPLYVNIQGRPKDLPYKADNGVSFSRLVELELPGEDPKVCLDVLVSVESIAKLNSGALRWLRRDTVSAPNSANTLHEEEFLLPIKQLLLNFKVGLTEKVPTTKTGPIQRSVSGFELHPGDIEALHGMFNRHGMEFLWMMDDWLTQRTKSRKNTRRNRNHVRPYIGLFMTMEPIRTAAKSAHGKERGR
jgi:predicted DNA-binding transcriptional regulator AlpA